MDTGSRDHSGHDAAPSGPPVASPRHGRRGLWVFLGFAAVAGFFLLTEHRAHLFGVLPYLLLLACPLMHLFHHGGHGGHDGHGTAAPDKTEGAKK